MITKLTLAAAGTLFLASTGRAQTYYTVDVANDTLYTINVSTGVATAVGPLGSDLDGVDMAWHQGALYAKSFVLGGGNNRIYQLVTNGMFAGTALPGGLINGGSYQGAEIAGLASNGTSLHLTYSVDPPSNPYYSTNFGSVNPMTGTITFLTTLPSDADNMGFVGTRFYTIDVIAPGVGYDVYTGIATPSTFVGNDTYDNSLDTNPVDSEFFSPTELVTVSQTGKKLVRVSRTTGARGLVTPITGSGLPPNFFMKGIARQPNPCANIATPVSHP